MSSPGQNVFATAFEINVGIGVGIVWMRILSDKSEQAVVSVANPLNTSTLTSSLLDNALDV